MSDPNAASQLGEPRSSARSALLALADPRTPEQVEADAEIDARERDEPDELIRALQNALAAAGSFRDLWERHNNLPKPPCPGCLERELAGLDLVAEGSMTVLSHERITASKERRAQFRSSTSERQMVLL